MTELRKNIIVFWGSQSGNAERLTNNFVRECIARFNLPAMAANLDLYDYDQLGQLSEGRLVGFVLAAYGEGNSTDNAAGLYEYLCKMILFYGSCSEEDCLCTDIWSEAEGMGILESHFVFSGRLVDGEKVYVQHRLLDHAETTRRGGLGGGWVGVYLWWC